MITKLSVSVRRRAIVAQMIVNCMYHEGQTDGQSFLAVTLWVKQDPIGSKKREELKKLMRATGMPRGVRWGMLRLRREM